MPLCLYRNTLVVAGVSAALSFGVVGCSKTDELTDSAITAGVKGQLADQRDLDASDITIATANGTVTLRGSVPDTEARASAESATRSSAGVTNVNNRLTVQSPSLATTVKNAGEAAAQAGSDIWITSKVKSVLLADEDAKGLDVNVDTKDGVVTLKGKLTSQAAINHVKTLANGVEGVKRVNSTALTVAAL